MKAVVTGASGLLGRAVFAHLSSLDNGQRHQVSGLANSRAAPPLTQVDLLDADALRSHLQDFKPDVVIHCAAERRPDVVDKEPERSQELNVDVPARLTDMSKEMGFRLIYISTDYVFDGSKPPYMVDSEPNPLNAYGTSKLLGERMVRERGQEGMVTCLRVPVLYGPANSPSESAVNVLATTIVPPQDGRIIKMDAYAVRYPTSVTDVARVLADIAATSLQKPLPPILHYQATEAMTKYDMCNVLSRLQNRHAPPLPETSVSHLEPEFDIDPMAATARPRHCKLDTSVLADFGVDVGHVSFEEWWSGEMEREAAREVKRQEEEAAKLKAEEEEKERKRREEEEEERKRKAEEEEKERLRREEEEAQQRQRAEEEAKERQRREEDEEQAHKEAAAADQEGSSSAEAGKETRSDSGSRSIDRDASTVAPPREQSPHPSFSSLQARPTPPGTSDIRSPSTSQPNSLRNAEGTVQPQSQAPTQSRPVDADDSAPPTPPKPARPSAAAAQAEGSSTSTPQSSQTIRPNPFRQPHEMPAQLDTAARRDPDEDEEIYGQASPHPSRTGAQRPTMTAVDGEDGEPRTFAAKGYGEVKAGLDDESASKGAAVPPVTSGPAQHSFTIKVGDPHKVGDGMTGHIVYTVRTTTTAPGFKASQFSSLRRYSDFRWLHAALVHNNPGIIIPPVPEKVRGLISRFSPDLVEARRHGLETCVNKICAHPVLSKDEDLKLFLESEDFTRDVKARDARKGPVPTPEQKTWMGWSGTVGVNSGQKFHEFDEWFDNQRAYLDSLEAQLKLMVKGINALSQSRKELADSIAASSHALMMLSGSSLSRSLSAAFAGLGDLQRRAQELEEIQSDRDIRQFGSVLYEYERIVGSVRKAFSSRIDCWHSMVKADEDFRKARVRHDRLKGSSAGANGSGSYDAGGSGSSYHHYHQYEESVRDLGEAETRALEARSRFDVVGKRCKDEMARFDRERCKDVMAAVDAWLSGMLERREEMLGEWEEYARRCLGLELGEPKEEAVAKVDEGGSAAAPAAQDEEVKASPTVGTAEPTTAVKDKSEDKPSDAVAVVGSDGSKEESAANTNKEAPSAESNGDVEGTQAPLQAPSEDAKQQPAQDGATVDGAADTGSRKGDDDAELKQDETSEVAQAAVQQDAKGDEPATL